MIWLQSGSRYDDVAEYDHASGTFSIISKTALRHRAPQETDGQFDLLSNVFVALYKFGDDIFLRIGNDRFPLSDDVIAEVHGDRVTKRLIANKAKLDRTLIVKKAGQEIAHLNYIYDLWNQFPVDFTQVEDEDFDFGLWVSNMTKSPTRQRILLGSDE